MLTVETLREWGADVDAGMKRCMNNESFYLKMVSRAVPDPSFDGLKAAVEAGDLERGFELAHAIKGMMGNLGLTPLYELSSEMTELLRAGKDADYADYLAGILRQRETLLALCDD